MPYYLALPAATGRANFSLDSRPPLRYLA